MRTRLLWASLSVAIALAPAFAAEAVKLRARTSVYADSKGVSLSHPEGVACGEGSIVVADTGNGRIVVYEIADRVVEPRTEIVVPEAPSPIRVQIDAKGDLLVLDGKSRRIARVAKSGEFRGFVSFDTNPAPVVRAFSVGAAGEIAVLDLAGRAVLVGDGAGKLARRISLPEECRFPSDVAFDPSGRVIVLDSVGGRLFAAAKNETTASPLGASLREDLDFATSLAIDRQGRIFVVDQNGGGIVALGPDGSFRGRQSGMGWIEGMLRWPSSICVGIGGEIAVADRENHRVTLFAASP